MDNLNPAFYALSEEAKFTREILGSGVTQIGRANYAQKGIYFQAFSSLSTGLERIGKLCVILDYYIRNNGKFPDQKYIKCKLARNLVEMWDSGDFYQKQIFQNTLFPSGLGYDAKLNHYRTPEINSVISYIAGLSKGFEQNKKETSQNLDEKSLLVPCGLELSNFIDDFQGLRILMNSRNWNRFCNSNNCPLISLNQRD